MDFISTSCLALYIIFQNEIHSTFSPWITILKNYFLKNKQDIIKNSISQQMLNKIESIETLYKINSIDVFENEFDNKDIKIDKVESKNSMSDSTDSLEKENIKNDFLEQNANLFRSETPTPSKERHQSHDWTLVGDNDNENDNESVSSGEQTFFIEEIESKL